MSRDSLFLYIQARQRKKVKKAGTGVWDLGKTLCVRVQRLPRTLKEWYSVPSS